MRAYSVGGGSCEICCRKSHHIGTLAPTAWGRRDSSRVPTATAGHLLLNKVGDRHRPTHCRAFGCDTRPVTPTFPTKSQSFWFANESLAVVIRKPPVSYVYNVSLKCSPPKERSPTSSVHLAVATFPWIFRISCTPFPSAIHDLSPRRQTPSFFPTPSTSPSKVAFGSSFCDCDWNIGRNGVGQSSSCEQGRAR